MKQIKFFVLVWVLVLAAVVSAPAQDNGKLSGTIYSDYYYVVKNHKSELEDLNGFWFRRIYVTYDRGLSEELSMRIRFEMASPGDFSTSETTDPSLKDGYVKWKRGRTQVFGGLSGSPTWGLVEKTWGYRAVEKTPLDLQKFGSSRDFGLAVKGKVDEAGKLAYHLMVGNGNSNKSETDKGKKAMGSIAIRPGGGLIVEAYVDYQGKNGDNDVFTVQGFAAYQHEKGRAGVQFAHQTRKVEGGNDVELQIGSAFLVVKLSDKVSALARVDRMFDPNPSGEKISYIPFDKTAESTFGLAGLDFALSDKLHLIPNVEVVSYDKNAAGVTPDLDLIGRVTAYVKY